MQIIKPLHLSPLNRSFTYQRQHFLSLGALYGFELGTGKPVLEQDLWTLIAATPEIQVLDAALPKPQAEFLVYGCAETPAAQPRKELAIHIEVAGLKKQLQVSGPGFWRGLPGFRQPQIDATFTRLPLSRALAYGGKGFAENPEGLGHQQLATDTGENLYPITQLQLLGTPATTPGEPLPLAFTGAMDFMAPQRQQHAGTYDAAYQQNAMPGLPDDFDWLFCQDALPDQRFNSGQLPRAASYRLQNLNARLPLLEGQLPDWQAQAWLLQQTAEDPQHRPIKVSLHAETLFLLPNQQLGILLYRGQHRVSRDDARDIKALMLALEDPANPKPDQHYTEQLQLRSDQANAWRYLLDTQPLLPNQLTCGMQLLLAQGAEMPALDQPQMDKAELLAAAAQDQAMQNLDKERAALQQQGIALPPLPAPPQPPEWQAQIEALQARILPKKPDGTPDLVKVDFDAMQEIGPLVEQITAQELQQAKNEALPQLEALLQIPELEPQYPLILQKIEALKNPPRSPWPRMDVQAQLDEVQQQLQQQAQEVQNLTGLPDEQRIKLQQQLAMSQQQLQAMQQQLQDATQKIKDTYRMGAEQLEQGAPLRSETERQTLRQQVLAAVRAHQPLPTDDLSDLDLSGQQLDDVDFSNCYMEGINLTGSSLRGACLQGVILVHAELVNTDFTGAAFEGANLGASQIKNCRFDQARLHGVNFNKARLHGNSFIAAQLDQTQWLASSISHCNFSSASLTGLNLVDPVLEQCNFTAANLSQCNLVNPVFNACRFDRLKAEGSNFVKMQAPNTSFVEAQLNNVRFVSGCQLQSCDFSRAQLNLASFREAVLTNSRFDAADMAQADLELADLSGSSLKKARLFRANLANANFSNASLEDANLMESVLYHARVVNADLRGANLYAANLLYLEHGQTRFDFANLDRTLLQDWRP